MILSQFKLLLQFLFYGLPCWLFINWWLFKYKQFSWKVTKYEKRFRRLVNGNSVFGGLFALLVYLYFFPELLYSQYGFLEVNEKTLQDLLQVSFTVTGVIFGVFLQQGIEFLIMPEKEVLYPLDKKALFHEFYAALEEFSDKLKEDDRLLDEEAKITILLSSPILVDFIEIDKILDNEKFKNYRTKWEILIYDIFNNPKVSKKIICLNVSHLQSQGYSPLQRFIKSFSGYVISEHYKNNNIKDDFFYDKVDTFRKNITRKILTFCQEQIIKKNIVFAKEDDLQWQAIVIHAPKIRFYKAIVGFYGEDFFKKYSRLGLMSSLKKPLENPDNRGFVSDEPDIVKWVEEGLIAPYIPDPNKKQEEVNIPTHHSSEVHNKITKEWLERDGETEEKVMIDDLKKLGTVQVSYKHGRNSILREIDYPIYDGTQSPPIKIIYCQPLFHPLIAESATWSSLNIRMPGNNGGKILDMCCGIGVQGLAAIDKGAKFVHGVDSDPIALLCAIENYKRKVSCKSDVKVSVTLSEGFGEVKEVNFDKFGEIFEETLNNPIWHEILKNDNRKNELRKLFNDNKDYASQIYTQEIPKDFDLIILEPPFVEFSQDNNSPSHDSLYDKHFKVIRDLLEHAKDFLRLPTSPDTEDWENPYIMQGFSSLENIIEFETYIETVANYKIFRKACVQKNGVYWYCYHLIPNQD